MKKLKRLGAALLLVAITIVPNVAYAATGKVTTINMTNLYNAYNSTKKTWNELKTAKHRLMGSFVAYCLQHKATVPNSQTYNLTDVMDNYSSKVRTGLQIIVENGYPFETGGLSAAQAEYATANAIRFWMTECGDDQFYNMTNLGSFSASQLRSLAAAGTITKKIQVRDAAYIPALQFSVELLIKARAQVLMEHRVDLSASSISAARSGDVFTGSTTVTTVNLHGGYRLDQSALPSGSTVSGYTGKDGDVLTISIPASASTANKTYTLTLTGRDDRVRSNMQVFCHNTDQAYQRVLCVRTGSDWYADCCTSTLTIITGDYEAPRPDLTITALASDAASYEAGGMMTITATVKNQGSTAAGSSDLSLSGSGIATQRQSIGALAVGASKQLTFSVPAPDMAQTLTLTAFADCDEVVAESNEDNNTQSVSVEIVKPLLPDLTVTSVTPAKASYRAGETVTISTTIKNQGEADAGSFVVRFSPSGTSAQTRTVSGLKVGESTTLTWTFTAPVLSETEVWLISVTADSTGVIAESDETNNSLSGSVTILGEKPDLCITSLTHDADSYAPGETITFTAVVRNNGIIACPESQIRFSGAEIASQTKPLSRIPAGGSVAVSFALTAPGIVGEKTYTVTAMADPNNTVDESDESNNSRSSSFTVYNPLPDLTVTRIQSNKNEYADGETGAVTVTVSNQGGRDVTNAKLKLAIGDFHSEVKQTGAIASGSSVRISFTFTAPEVLERREVMVTATADPTNEIVESNEANNTLTSSLAIKPVLPDLGITNTNATNWYAGKDVVITATVVNYTSQAVPSVTVRLTVGTNRYEEAIPLPGNGSNLAVFRVTLPTQTGATPIRFIVDPYNALPEENEGNNSYDRTIQIVNAPAGTVIDPDSAELEAHYASSGLLPLPSTENSDYHIWQEVRLEDDEYVTKTFWAQMQTAFEVTPDERIAYADKPRQMESGFGVNTNLITTITTNYDHPEKLVGCQMAWVYAPETGYGQIAQWSGAFDSLERIGDTQGARITRWQQKVNPYSEAGSRLHYTPLWFPDGQYTLLCQSFYAWTPAGQMYWYDVGSVDILGDMYDRVTAIQGR
ncbi:MAG: CARDB domain-containing protein [Candidatus Faecivicinus sp.]